MVKNKYFVLLLLLGSLVFSVGCDIDTKQIVDQETNMSYEIETAVFQNVSDRHNDTIKYPQLYRDGEGMVQINELIEGYVMENTIIVADGYDELETSIDIDYQVMYNNDNIISIVFSGLAWAKRAAHPTHTFFTLTLDLDKASRLRLQDFYDVNDTFIKIYLENLKQQVNEERFTAETWEQIVVDYIENRGFSAEDFENADDGRVVSSYLTKDGLGISMTIPYAIGDHVETIIKYSEIEKFRKKQNTL